MKLIDLEKDWIPDGPGQSLYIRPFIFSTDPYLGVSVGQYYKMMIILLQLVHTMPMALLQ